MDFFLFMLVNLALFVRPSEVVPDLEAVPVYNILIIIALVAALPRVVQQLQPQTLMQQPITLCVLLLLPAIVLSHLANFVIWQIQMNTEMFLKIQVYYLLLTGVLNTTRRLRKFLLWVTVFAAANALVAMLHFYGVIDIPSLRIIESSEVIDPQTGAPVVIKRLCSTGFFNDPNDLAMVAVLGIVIALYALTDREGGASRFLWLIPLGILLLTVVLTKSRGGTLALGLAVAALAYFRWGATKALLGVLLFLPLAALAVQGRGAAMQGGTGMSRVMLWAEGMRMIKQSPLFGVGCDNFSREVRQVAHNSFMQCFAELGLFGGALFFGAFWFAGLSLWRLRHDLRDYVSLLTDGVFQRLQPCLTAIMAGTLMSMMSLTRSYVLTTYLVLGLVNAYCVLGQRQGIPQIVNGNVRRFAELVPLSICFLGATYLFIRLNPR
ncbi:MAG: O-antigen ligase family protein [Planctomycetaceae bacterium]